MADGGQNSTSNLNANNPQNSANTPRPEDSEILEYTGWLMKRTRLSHKWEKNWFRLRKTELVYGRNPQNLTKRIPLVGSQISETTVDKKQFAFKLKAKDGKRVYFMHAENEDSQQEWMQAICFAKAAGTRKDQSEACVIQ